MISLWLSLAFLLCLSLAFVFWPMWRYRALPRPALGGADSVGERLQENVRLFHEHLAELQQNLASGAIDESQFQQLKLELERGLLNDEASLTAVSQPRASWLGTNFVAVFVAMVLCAGVLFYKHYGSADDVVVQALQQEKMRQDYEDMLQNREPSKARAQALIDKIKTRLDTKTDNLQYWFLLARSHIELGEYDKAVSAYQEIMKRDAQSPIIMSELAQAMFLRDGNKMSPPIVDLAKNTLALDPKNTVALGLMGIDAFGRKDYAGAVSYWKKSVALLGADSQGSQALQAGIEKATKEFVAAGGKLDALNATSAYTLRVSVKLGSQIESKLSKDAVVFVYARAWKGSPMPLAIKRLNLSELPAVVTLDETMAMSPAASLATASEVEVVARVSAEGTAQAKVGDWQAKQGPINMASVPEHLVLEVNEQLTEATLSR